MKKILIGSCMTLAASVVFAQYKPVDNGSAVRFTIKNIGINVDGSLKGLAGNINFDPQHLESASFDVTVDANTVNTDNSLRDDHLKKETYFDAGHYKTMHFVSTKITTSTKKDTYFVFGKLTIKNTTKDISFPFTANASDAGYTFKGNFGINRRDFNVGGASIISDALQVSLNIVANK